MVKKVFLALLIITLMFVLFSHFTEVQATSASGIVGGADDFISHGQGGFATAINPKGLSDTVDLIYNTLLIVGTCVAVIVATVLGIQFITGSVEQKVKVKESIIPFVIGCVVIFGAFGIWRLVIILIR